MFIGRYNYYLLTSPFAMGFEFELNGEDRVPGFLKTNRVGPDGQPIPPSKCQVNKESAERDAPDGTFKLTSSKQTQL